MTRCPEGWRSQSVVRRLASPGEVEHDCVVVGPEIEVAAGELRALVDPDSLWITDRAADPLEGLDDVLTPIAEPGIERWREPREGIDERQDPDLPHGRQLVVDKVHRPGLVDLHRRPAVLAELRLDPPLRPSAYTPRCCAAAAPTPCKGDRSASDGPASHPAAAEYEPDDSRSGPGSRRSP